MFGISYAKLGIGLGIAILIGLAAWGIKAGLDKIADQGAQIERLRTDLAAEKAARENDVRGLTALSQGILAASNARSLDEEVLRETIDSANPQPVSPGLSRFLSGLRANDRAAGAAAPGQRPNGAAPGGASRPAGR